MNHAITTPFGTPEFLVLAGSRLYGIDGPTSDYDYVGAVVEPAEYRVGLKNYHPTGKNHQHGFEQHEFSGDNYEGTVYSLWKLAEMFATGNPTVLCLMFAEPLVDTYGICTESFRSIVRSKHAGKRFLAYMAAQRKSMIGQRATHVTRTDLIEAHGFDTKFAGHLIRLGYQGIEYLTTGSIPLPLPPEQRKTVLQVRRGVWSENEVLYLAESLETQMQDALAQTDLPDEPDHEALSRWVVFQYESSWFAS